MYPGKPQLLTCPHCGNEKEVIYLLSGNTFGAELWSDNKMIAPQLPEASYVQRCPHCGKYYIMERQEVRFSKSRSSFEQGLLTFEEMKEAFSQISSEGFESTMEEGRVRMMLHHAFNDFRGRTGKKKELSEADQKLFTENAKWAIANIITSNMLKAEFYREIGEMDAAKAILDAATISDEFAQKIYDSIKKRIENNDNRVFRIQ